jgi:hypothetical protein
MILSILKNFYPVMLSLNFHFFIVAFLSARYVPLFSIFSSVLTFFIFMSFFRFFNAFADEDSLVENQDAEIVFSPYVSLMKRFFYGLSYVSLIYSGIFCLHDVFSLYAKGTLLSIIFLIVAILFIFVLVSNAIHNETKIFFSLLSLFVGLSIFFILRVKNKTFCFGESLHQISFFESFYRTFGQIPLLLTIFFPLLFSEEKKRTIIESFLCYFVIAVLYCFFSLFCSYIFSPKKIFSTFFSQLFFYTHKEYFYFSHMINIVVGISIIFMICTWYTYAAKQFQKLIPVFDGKKIFSEIFIFFLLTCLLFFFYKRFSFFVPLLSFYVLMVSLSSMLMHVENILNRRSDFISYLSIFGNLVACIISLFDMIFLKL